ncbi:MAG: hypothetical protein JF600_12905 [Xanthomonadales bacterium]|nr:hypothetical protein [Xanthomonadales bacterium]
MYENPHNACKPKKKLPPHGMYMARDMQISKSKASLLWAIFTLTSFSARCEDAVPLTTRGSCETSKAAFKSARKGADKAKASIDIIDSCGLGNYQKLTDFDEAFGTSFDLNRKNLPKGSFNTSVLYFDPQKDSADDSVAADNSGWYLAIKYSSNGLVINYVITNAHK